LIKLERLCSTQKPFSFEKMDKVRNFIEKNKILVSVLAAGSAVALYALVAKARVNLL